MLGFLLQRASSAWPTQHEDASSSCAVSWMCVGIFASKGTVPGPVGVTFCGGETSESRGKSVKYPKPKKREIS